MRKLIHATLACTITFIFYISLFVETGLVCFVFSGVFCGAAVSVTSLYWFFLLCSIIAFVCALSRIYYEEGVDEVWGVVFWVMPLLAMLFFGLWTPGGFSFSESHIAGVVRESNFFFMLGSFLLSWIAVVCCFTITLLIPMIYMDLFWPEKAYHHKLSPWAIHCGTVKIYLKSGECAKISKKQAILSSEQFAEKVQGDILRKYPSLSPRVKVVSVKRGSWETLLSIDFDFYASVYGAYKFIREYPDIRKGLIALIRDAAGVIPRKDGKKNVKAISADIASVNLDQEVELPQEVVSQVRKEAERKRAARHTVSGG